jgi:hypothetical protein
MSEHHEPRPGKIIVPGEPHRLDDEGEALVRPEDIESTSRSCLAIIIILILIVLMICVFLLVQPFVN